MVEGAVPVDLYEVLETGSVVAANFGSHWIVTWLPHGGTAGWILDSREREIPTERGADGILEWAKQQPWAKP